MPVSLEKPGADAACAAAASGIATIVANPFEVAKTRLQLQRNVYDIAATRPAAPPPPAQITASASLPRYRGSIHAIVTIGRTEGIRGWYRGVVGFAGYRIAMNGPRLGLFHPAKRLLRGRSAPAVLRSLPDEVHVVIASAATGFVGSVFGNPFNVVKARCMTVAAASSTSGDGAAAIRVAQDIMANEGLAGFFRGLSAGAPRVMVGSASQLTTYEVCKRWLVSVSTTGGDGGITRNLAGRPLTEHDWEVHTASSVVASAVSTTCFCPFDVISSRLYVADSTYKGFWDCARRTVRGEGWFALERGWLALYARTGPTSTLTMVLWEAFRDKAGCI